MTKPKVAFYWCASCGGCEEAVVDLNEVVLDVVEAVDIAFWPVALDFKVTDVEALADGELAASFINGAIRTSEQREMVELLRRKSGAVVAFGACAWLGGIPGLANLSSREEILDEVYRASPSSQSGDGTLPQEETDVPEGRLRLPHFDETVRTLDQVIDVDYYLPGCPPPEHLIVDAVMALVGGTLPEKGSVLAPDVALCAECPRAETKPQDLKVQRFHRPYEIVADPETCLLAQGLVCLGPATRSGCHALCIAANMPCTGCMGPTSRVIDHGAKALSAIASLMETEDREEIAALAEEVVDPVGTFYRYSLPASLLHRRVAPDGDRAAEPVGATSGGGTS
jgi:F420-non-reducing hydrogenase small subunit